MKRHQLLKVWTGILLLGTVPFSLSLIAGCGSGNSSTSSTPPPVTGAVTPTVTVAASPSGGVSNAQAVPRQNSIQGQYELDSRTW
jgi:hypothetical protein